LARPDIEPLCKKQWNGFNDYKVKFVPIKTSNVPLIAWPIENFRAIGVQKWLDNYKWKVAQTKYLCQSAPDQDGAGSM
jgi:hypothetical protein